MSGCQAGCQGGCSNKNCNCKKTGSACACKGGCKNKCHQFIRHDVPQRMPLLGLGTWLSTPEEIERAVDAALEAGYRHIDTAFNYQNEASIGNVLKRWFTSGKIKRSELFIVTKLPMVGMRYEDVGHFMQKSLDALQLDYVDLYLVHGPFGLQKKGEEVFPLNEKGEFLFDMKTDLLSVWKGVEEQLCAGRTRAIGISNFTAEQIQRICKNARIKPHNLQVELHAGFQQKLLRGVCAKNNISVTAYAPLGSPGKNDFLKTIGMDESKLKNANLLENPTVADIAKKYKKKPSQVLLRFLVQQKICVIPKSVTPSRIVENSQIWDFVLSAEDMIRMDSLDLGEAGRTFEFFGLKGLEHHPECPFKDYY